MSVLHNGPGSGGAERYGKAAGGVAVKCPKCQTNITVTAEKAMEPVRCTKCQYPLIRDADLKMIVDACIRQNQPGNVDSAAGILRNMSDYMPEAGTALGQLANRQLIPVSESERWDRLVNAYAGGDDEARDWLNLMCQTSPDHYRQYFCKSCGAPNYDDIRRPGERLCVYCRSAEREG